MLGQLPFTQHAILLSPQQDEILRAHYVAQLRMLQRMAESDTDTNLFAIRTSTLPTLPGFNAATDVISGYTRLYLAGMKAPRAADVAKRCVPYRIAKPERVKYAEKGAVQVYAASPLPLGYVQLAPGQEHTVYSNARVGAFVYEAQRDDATQTLTWRLRIEYVGRVAASQGLERIIDQLVSKPDRRSPSLAPPSIPQANG